MSELVSDPITITKPINLSKPTIYCIPVDVLRIIGKKLGISWLTKLCIAVPKLDKLLADDNVEMYKHIMSYEKKLLLLLRKTCRFNSVPLLIQVILDHPKAILYYSNMLTYAWNNNAFNVYNMLHGIYITDNLDLPDLHYDLCKQAVVSGDMGKINHVVAYFTDAIHGTNRCQKLLEHLPFCALHRPEVYLHLIQINCITSGIESVFVKMCTGTTKTSRIEKLYHAVKHRIDKVIIQNMFRSYRYPQSVETMCFLIAEGLYIHSVYSIRWNEFTRHPKDVKTFTQKYAITSELVNVLLIRSLRIQNIENVAHLLTLDWQPQASIFDMFLGLIIRQNYKFLRVFTPYIDKIMAYPGFNETSPNLFNYLCNIGYSSENPQINEKIITMNTIADQLLAKLLEHNH